jgi:four helix bundle protein
MAVRRFEDLIAWQKARVLTKVVYETSRRGAFAKDWGLSGQIQRAAVSAMSNIAEGFERARTREFHQFLSVAKGSVAEVRSLLYAALDIGYLDQRSFDELDGQAMEVGRIIGALRASLERQSETGRGGATQHSAPSTQH